MLQNNRVLQFTHRHGLMIIRHLDTTGSEYLSRSIIFYLAQKITPPTISMSRIVWFHSHIDTHLTHDLNAHRIIASNEVLSFWAPLIRLHSNNIVSVIPAVIWERAQTCLILFGYARTCPNTFRQTVEQSGDDVCLFVYLSVWLAVCLFNNNQNDRCVLYTPAHRCNNYTEHIDNLLSIERWCMCLRMMSCIVTVPPRAGWDQGKRMM